MTKTKSDHAMLPGAAAPGMPGPTPRTPVFCGELGMRIARDGTWYYHGSPIGRKPLVRLFSSVLRREADGVFYLVTPVQKGIIAVDDAPFVAVALMASGAGRSQVLSFRTNVDDVVTADATHPIRVTGLDRAAPAPYVLVRDGLEALIARAVYYDLVGLGTEETRGNESVWGVWSSGSFFTLGSLTE
ncbi:MAG: DUF1285 domain-containing protein [Alphaproteobacteria bacterium]|nr:DUF1285 domain-containing protein [Alphaproteobacteria bacterium]